MNSRVWQTMAARTAGIVLVLALCLAGSGCGGPPNRVSGKASFGGKALSSGTVLLLASDGQPYRGLIAPDGTFVIPSVPPGPAQVAVTSLGEQTRSSGRGRVAQNARIGLPAATFSRLPLRYGDLAQSGLSVTVAGDTVLNLDLK